jgi:hypothetical protein
LVLLPIFDFQLSTVDLFPLYYEEKWTQ